MTNRVPLNLSDLDFDGIKQSLLEYLKSNESPIKDYNYEGSAFNILLDTLAANAHLQSLYSNFIANEMFLDSALLRSSVVSIAKELGYFPRSAKASRATVRVSVSPYVAGNDSLTIPAGSRFTTNVDGESFTYVNLFDEIVDWSSAETAYVGTFDIWCGEVHFQDFTYTSGSRLFVDADGVDISTLTVLVQNSISDTYTQEYLLFDDLLSVNEDSFIYHLKETDLLRYEVTFGDGVLGKQLSPGNIVRLRYLAATPEAPYNASSFIFNETILGNSLVAVSTVVKSGPYVPVEDVDSIRTNAKRSYQSQNRSVIASDYAFNITHDFPEVIDVSVWGGEDNNPPQYGKVFVSCVLQSMTTIPDSKKEAIKLVIKKKNMMNVRPEVVNPEFIRVTASGYVRYSSRLSATYSVTDIKNELLSNMSLYSSTYLERFNRSLDLTELAEFVREKSPMMGGLVLTFKVSSFVPLSEKTNNTTKYFRNSAKPGSLFSDKYTKDGNTNDTYTLKDVAGKVVEYRYVDDDENNVVLVGEVGVIDYDSGKVDIKSIRGTSLAGSGVWVGFTVDSSEVVSSFNQIIVLDAGTSSTSIQVIAK